MGSWPAVKTILPVRTAGTYAAKGLDETGSTKPFSASFARTSTDTT